MLGTCSDASFPTVSILLSDQRCDLALGGFHRDQAFPREGSVNLTSVHLAMVFPTRMCVSPSLSSHTTGKSNVTATNERSPSSFGTHKTCSKPTSEFPKDVRTAAKEPPDVHEAPGEGKTQHIPKCPKARCTTKKTHTPH